MSDKLLIISLRVKLKKWVMQLVFGKPTIHTKTYLRYSEEARILKHLNSKGITVS